MAYVEYLKNPELESFEKSKGEELIIIPKKNFLDWYKYTRGVVKIQMKKVENGKEFEECPNCRGTMENHKIKTNGEEELWHLCTRCNLNFTQRQREQFTKIILEVINNE